MLLTVRTVIANASGSVFIYLLQLTLDESAVAGAFLLSVPAGRPLAERGWPPTSSPSPSTCWRGRTCAASSCASRCCGRS